MGKKLQSDFLFAQPSFGSGVASNIDLWGQLADYNSSDSAAEADANAIYSDWVVVGDDLCDAMDQIASDCDAA